MMDQSQLDEIKEAANWALRATFRSDSIPLGFRKLPQMVLLLLDEIHYLKKKIERLKNKEEDDIVLSEVEEE